MSRVMLVRAWPRIRLTWTTSRRMSMIRWLAKVWRQVVEAHPPPVAIETGVDGGAAHDAPRDVAVEERRARVRSRTRSPSLPPNEELR